MISDSGGLRGTGPSGAKEAVTKGEAQLIAVYGRRRVGKTYLVREVFGDRFFFHHSGLAKGSMDEQLAAFRDSLAKYGLTNVPALANWREAFNELERLIDELPWLDTPKSGFVNWFEHFWNGFASGRKEVVLVICGSARVEKVIRLFIRVGEQIEPTDSEAVMPDEDDRIFYEVTLSKGPSAQVLFDYVLLMKSSRFEVFVWISFGSPGR